MGDPGDKKTAKIGQGKAGPGRPKGMLNKSTALLKDAILEAAAQAGGDGGLVAYLKMQAHTTPGPFMALLGKVLPTQLTGDPASPVQMITRIERVIIDADDECPADKDPEEVRTTH